MYPNYTKTFLDVEGVSIKKVVQADSFIILENIRLTFNIEPQKNSCANNTSISATAFCTIMS